MRRRDEEQGDDNGSKQAQQQATSSVNVVDDNENEHRLRKVDQTTFYYTFWTPSFNSMLRRRFIAVFAVSVCIFAAVWWRGDISHELHSKRQHEAPPRLIFMTAHKWGHFLSESIARQYFAGKGVSLQHVDRFRHLSTNTKVVMFVRNVVDSVVSGYLYHKSGRECWLNGVGVPLNGTPGWLASPELSTKWKHGIVDKEQRYKHSTKNLCEILRDTDVESGVWIYAQVAYSAWYRSTFDAFHYFAKRGHNVLYLCMNVIQRNIPQAVAKIKAFYNGKTYSYNGPKTSSRIYTGGHSTSTNETLRHLLRGIVQDVDRNTGSKLARLQELYKCESSLSKP